MVRVLGWGIFSLLFVVTEAMAQEAGVAAQPSALGRMLPLFFIVFFIFYFLVIRPQDKKLRAQEALLKDLSKGDMVVTSSGVIGRVAGIEKDHILLEISNNVRVKYERTHVVKPYATPKKEEVKSTKKSKNAA
jgi:preprotein translocase subunit YajC